MPMSAMDGIAREFYNRGFVVLKDVLPPEDVKSFLECVEEDLSNLDNAESGNAFKGPISLSDPKSWPKGKSRRVAECAPVRQARHWTTLTDRISEPLSSIVGKGAWHLPMNQAAADIPGKLVGPRHWYAPVAFPECPPQGFGTPTSATGRVSDWHAVDDEADACPGPRPALFISSLEEQATNGPPTPATAHRRWHPVSRRRFLHKGKPPSLCFRVNWPTHDHQL